MRASRLLSILILLQLRGRLTADDLAAEFDVSVRTIYRDVDALSAAGVPIYGDRGPGGGFQLLDGYRTQLTGLLPEEAEALFMIGLPGPAADLGLLPAAGTARRKMLAALPGEGGALAGRMAERFHVDPTAWYASADPVPHLQAIARATLDQRRLTMRYESWSATREWSVDPLGLVLKGGAWYLAALGHGKVRVFRIAGIAALQVSEEGFARPASFDLAKWWHAEQERFEAELFSTTATVHASALGCRRLAAQSSRGAQAVAAAGPPDARGWRAIELAVEDSDHGARAFLELGAEAEIIAPAGFRRRVARLAAEIARLNRPVRKSAARGVAG